MKKIIFFNIIPFVLLAQVVYNKLFKSKTTRLNNKLFFVFNFFLLFCFSCQKEEPNITPPKHTEQTVFMYMPWSSNLTTYFYSNIEDIKIAIKKKASETERVVCFFATTANTANLFEIRYFNGECIQTELKKFNVGTFTTASGISSLIQDVKFFAPASRYAMTISSHGMGWLPIDSTKSHLLNYQKYHWEYEGVLLTRYFGGLSPEYQIEIKILAQGIKQSNTHMEYILFDDCYMSNVEVAFDLKDVADYLIASPTEIMAFGFPYATLGKYLLGDVNYTAIVNEFNAFYSNYKHPYGTIGVSNLSEIEQMAQIMKNINVQYDNAHLSDNDVQRMDGYAPIIFFDYKSYVNKLCKDTKLLEQFTIQLNKFVPYKTHTESFYSMGNGIVKIESYAGITISDLSRNDKATTKNKTLWYQATH